MTKLLIGLGILIVIGAMFGALLTLREKLFPDPEQEPLAEGEESVRRVAVVHCTGGGASFSKYNYQGVRDCLAAAQLPGGGALSCDYGCLGMGTCEKVCSSGALSVQNGVAVVDRERCMACGKCIAVCPRHLIALETFRPKRHVSIPCASMARDEVVTAICTDGCIGCSICAKTCPRGAVTVEEGLARIDQEKCDSCGLCASKCPRHLIRVEKVAEPPKPEPPKVEAPKKVKGPKLPKAPRWSEMKGSSKEEKQPETQPVPAEQAPAAAVAFSGEERVLTVGVPSDGKSDPKPDLVETPKAEPDAPVEEKPEGGAKTSAEAFKAFEQAVAAAGEALGEEKGTDPAKEPAAAAADGGAKTE